MLAEYLEHAINFERMAAEEKNPQIKSVFEKQAATYRKLLAERGKKFGLDDPRYQNLSNDDQPTNLTRNVPRLAGLPSRRDV
jgi:hypothetical protein